MNVLNRRRRFSHATVGIIVLVALILGSADNVGAAEISGTVRSATPEYATVTTESDLMPAPGDKAEIFFKLPGADVEISVASGHIYEITGPNIMVKIDNATGTVVKDQLVKIDSPNPKKRSPSSSTVAESSPVPPSVASGTVAPLPPPPLVEKTPSPPNPFAKTLSDEAARFFEEGRAKFGANDFNGAIAAYTKSIELEPTKAEAYTNRGGAYDALGQPERGLADLNEAIRLNPNEPIAYSNRGDCYADLHQLQRAIEDYNEAIRLDPKSAIAYNNRASVYSEMGQKKIAIEDLNKAIALNPTYVEAVANRAALYKFIGKKQLAKRDFARAQELKAGTTGASATSSSAAEPAAMPVDRRKAAPNAAPQWTDLVNPAQKIVGTWQGARHRKEYFADGTFVTDPHLVPNAPRAQWRIQGDRLTEYYPESSTQITFTIASITDRELVLKDVQGHTSRSTRIPDEQAQKEKANW